MIEMLWNRFRDFADLGQGWITRAFPAARNDDKKRKKWRKWETRSSVNPHGTAQIATWSDHRSLHGPITDLYMVRSQISTWSDQNKRFRIRIRCRIRISARGITHDLFLLSRFLPYPCPFPFRLQMLSPHKWPLIEICHGSFTFSHSSSAGSAFTVNAPVAGTLAAVTQSRSNLSYFAFTKHTHTHTPRARAHTHIQGLQITRGKVCWSCPAVKRNGNTSCH